MAENICLFPCRTGTVFHELVDARPAVQSDGQCRLVHGNAYCRVYPAADVGRVDKPDAETQPHGGRV